MNAHDNSMTYVIGSKPHKLVYAFITKDTGHVKIGIAWDPWERQATLQTANHEEVCMAGFLVPADAKAKERELHRRFADTHVGGEWFAWSDDLDAFFTNEVCTDWDELAKVVSRFRKRRVR